MQPLSCWLAAFRTLFLYAKGTPVKSCPASVYFAFDSSALTPDSKAGLVWPLKKLQRFSERITTIFGFADMVGTPEYNMKLSERRTRAVSKYLQKRGISAERISIDPKSQELLTLDSHRQNINCRADIKFGRSRSRSNGLFDSKSADQKKGKK